MTKNRVVLGLLLAAALCGAFLIPQTTSKADAEWCFSQDFTLGQYDWFVRDTGEGSYSAGVGWVMGGAGRVVIQRAMPANATKADIEYTYVAGNGTKQALWRAGSSIADIGSFWAVMETSPNGAHSWHSEGGYFPTGRNYVELNIWASDDGTGSVTITRVVWRGTGTSDIGDNCSPTPTPTTSPTSGPSSTPGPTATPTPTATAVGTLSAVGIPFPACPLMPNAAYFKNFPGQWQKSSDSTAGNPSGATTGLVLPTGNSVSLTLPLSLQHQYSLKAYYHISSYYPSQSFQIVLGGSDPFSVPIANTTNRQTFTIDTSSYSPGLNGSYKLTLSRASDQVSVGLVIDYICVSQTDNQAPSAAPGSSPGEGETCQACEFVIPDTGNIIQKALGAIGGLFSWLFCQIRHFFECVFLALIAQIVNGIIAFFQFVWGLGAWIVGTVAAAFGWVFDSILAVIRWLGGNIGNIIIGLINGLGTFINGVIQAIINIGLFAAQVVGLVIYFIQFLIGLIVTVVGIVLTIIGAIVQFIISLFALVPEVIASIINGFNAQSLGTISGSIVCSNPSSIGYNVCLGFYVLDNTIFAGPAYYIFPIIIGLLAFETVLWALDRFRKFLEQG